MSPYIKLWGGFFYVNYILQIGDLFRNIES